MTTVCPSGHRSGTTDYCDQCGAPIPVASMPPVSTTVMPAVEDEDTSPAARREPCPGCGAPRSGDDRYCEGCGYDSSAARPAATWQLMVRADEPQFRRNASGQVAFPADYAEKTFPLLDAEVRIGRSRGRRSEQPPEVDLSGDPEDPGISRRHAVLERVGDGGYTVRDLGSTNGTTLNDGLVKVGADVAVPLADGDRIHIGAWTTLTLRKR